MSRYWPRARYRHPIDRQGYRWPVPRGHVFQDRTTGTLYLLSHDTATDLPTLVTPVPRQVFAVPEEPVLPAPAGNVRLFVSNGILRYELYTAPTLGGIGRRTVANDPVFTLNLSTRRTTYRLTADQVRRFGDPLCLQRYNDLGGTLAITDLGCNLFLETGGAVFEEGVFVEGVFD